MTRFWELSPIRFLEFYLVLLFIASLLRRLELYHSLLGMVRKVPGRWPRLFKLVQQHRMILFTLPTLLPAFLTLVLLLIHLTASRWIWPEAARPPHGLTFDTLRQYWWAAAVVVPLGVAMFGLDVYGLIAAGQIDRALLESYFDQAEYWLRSKTAHVVRFFTLGYINPRRMVATEVQKALVDASQLLNSTLWWMTVQLSFRIAFGLSLWLTWAITNL